MSLSYNHPLHRGCGEIGQRCREIAAGAARLLDIGPGIRPWPTESLRLCVEPYSRYADWLEAAGFMTIRATALEALPMVGKGFDAILMLDVIEHMTKEDGKQVIDMAVSRGKVVIFTPLGFMKQDGKDPWGMDGDYWQTHKSGWTPGDFNGWEILVNETFHDEHTGAFLAVKI